MPDFDPFGGNTSKGRDEYSYDSGKPSHSSSKVKSLITTIVVIGLLFFIVYFIFLYNAEVTINIKDTEGVAIDARVVISKDSAHNKKIATLNNLDSKTIRKGKYYYSVQKAGYTSITGSNFQLRKDKEISETLEKNIRLTINDIIFPKQVYSGQDVILQIDLENKSPSEVYNLDNLVFDGTIEDWNNFTVVDSYGNTINRSTISFQPQIQQSLLVKFTVPLDIDTKKKNTAKVRVKYKNDSESVDFEIIKEPEINISIKIDDEMVSGDSKSFKATIDNKKSDVTITDLTFTIDINGIINEDVASWFTLPRGEIYIENKKKIDELININIPSYARKEMIEGKIILNSSAFNDPKIFDIKLDITEPEIDFSIKLSKTNINLNYDVNLNTTNEEYIILTLTNKMDIDVGIDSIYYEDVTMKNDCSNYIYISPNSIPDTVLKNNDSEILINITAIDTNLIGDLVNNSRGCAIKVKYLHPFRQSEYLEDSENLTIFVE